MNTATNLAQGLGAERAQERAVVARLVERIEQRCGGYGMWMVHGARDSRAEVFGRCGGHSQRVRS